MVRSVINTNNLLEYINNMGASIVSFVVDNNPAHYYKAELLLYSLRHFALHPKQHIIVQCVKGLDKEFIDYLERNSYSYNFIDRYLDGKYCNKIQQLDFFCTDKYYGNSVILVDIDVFFLAPIQLPHTDKFLGKPVDAANPSLNCLTGIYKEAGIALPETVVTDWETGRGDTLATNFNGGFYYIPASYVTQINTYWKKWAEWLYARTYLFKDPNAIAHIDQVSIGLAIGELGLEHSQLSVNYNCPIHRNLSQKSYQADKPVTLIHYHNEINGFGIFNYDKAANERIKETIKKANRKIIAKKGSFVFLQKFKKNLVKSIIPPDDIVEIEISKILKSKKYKLVIHVGTPKTGTTSLQYFFDKHREELKSIGILYPSSNDHPPKHQWLVKCLLQQNSEILINNFKLFFENIDDNINTIILSTEGIYNHWFDFTPTAKSYLATLNKLFDLQIIVCFRHQADFAYSFYAQNLKNPQLDWVKCYGKDLSLGEMLEDSWFLKHIDYLSFIYEIETMFGEKSLNIIRYKTSGIKDFCEKLNINLNDIKEVNENKKLSSPSIEILRIVNRYPLDVEVKKYFLKLISEMDSIIGPYSDKAVVDKHSIEFINKLCLIDKNVLEKKYGLVFNKS